MVSGEGGGVWYREMMLAGRGCVVWGGVWYREMVRGTGGWCVVWVWMSFSL